MSVRLAFVEFKEELAAFEGQLDDLRIVTSLPPAHVVLASTEVPFFSSQDFFNKEGHDSVLKASAGIIELLRPGFESIEYPITHYCFERTCIFYLRFYLHYWLSQLELIDNAVKAVQPDTLVIQPFINLSRLNVPIARESKLLGGVVRAYARAHGLEAIVMPEGHQAGKGKDNRSGALQRWIFELFLMLYRVASLRRNVLVAPTDTNNMSALMGKLRVEVRKGLPVYLTIPHKSLKVRVKELLCLKSFFFPFLPGRASKWGQQQFSKSWREVLLELHRRIDANTEMLHFKGVDLSGPIKIFLDQGLTCEMHRLNGQVEAMERILRVKRPVACLSQHALGFSYALGEFCRNRNIPGLLISHGSHTAQDSEQARLEWDVHGRTLFNSHFPSVAIQSPFAGQFYNQQQMLSQDVDTGPLLFASRVEAEHDIDLLRKSLYGDHAGKRILLHAGTPKTWRAFRPWVYETVDEYVQNIVDVILATETVPGLYLAIRFRPMPDLSLREFRQLLPVSESYGIYSSGSFADYLLSSDAVVSYSSTTIEEALQNEIPVLQYDPQDKYCHIAGQRLGASGAKSVSPVYYIGSKQDLPAGLSWLKMQHLDRDINQSLNWSDYRMEQVDVTKWLSDMGVVAH